MKAFAFLIKICVKELLSTQIDIFSPPSDSGDAYSRGSLYGGEKRLASVDFDW